jgi:hypothetical protein
MYVDNDTVKCCRYENKYRLTCPYQKLTEIVTFIQTKTNFCPERLWLRRHNSCELWETTLFTLVRAFPGTS